MYVHTSTHVHAYAKFTSRLKLCWVTAILREVEEDGLITLTACDEAKAVLHVHREEGGREGGWEKGKEGGNENKAGSMYMYYMYMPNCKPAIL